MKMYMMADLIKHHNVNEMAEKFAQRGRICGRELGKRMSPEKYLRWGMRAELIELLPKYKWSSHYLGMGAGLERFFSLNFTRGWDAAVAEGDVK